MLRPHVDDDALLLALGWGKHGIPVGTGDGVDPTLGGVIGASVHIVRGCIVTENIAVGLFVRYVCH